MPALETRHAGLGRGATTWQLIEQITVDEHTS